MYKNLVIFLKFQSNSSYWKYPKTITLTLLNFNLIRGYIYKAKNKKVGFDDGCLRY
jgi:hypothetical protein